jgi:polysaccharide biosynthesis/export protein
MKPPALFLLMAAAFLLASPASHSAEAAAPAEAPLVPPGLPNSEDQSSQYRIGPGDTLQVFVWRNPELSAIVPVRPDGRVATPLVENMVAAGKTPAQMARDMEAVLGEYVRSPKVSIIVTVPVSTFSQIRVVGQVRTPQAIPFREGITVLDVILAVGGMGDYAAGNRAKIVRREGGKETEIRVRLNDLVNKGDMKQNVIMKPGDVIVIPQTLF